MRDIYLRSVFVTTEDLFTECVAKIPKQRAGNETTERTGEKKKLRKIDDINWFYILDEYVWGGHSTPTAHRAAQNIIQHMKISYFIHILNCGVH